MSSLPKCSIAQEDILLAGSTPEYYTTLQISGVETKRGTPRVTSKMVLLGCFILSIVAALWSAHQYTLYPVVDLQDPYSAGGSVNNIVPDDTHGPPVAHTTLYLTHGKVAKHSHALLQQHSRNVHRVGRFFTDAAQDINYAVSSAAKQTWRACRNFGRSISNIFPDDVKTPLVLIPTAVGVERYATSKGYTRKAVNFIGDTAHKTSNALHNAADYTVDRAHAAYDYAADHPRATGAAVTAVALPSVLEAVGLLDKNGLGSMGDAVKNTAGDGKVKTGHAFHNVVKGI